MCVQLEVLANDCVCDHVSFVMYDMWQCDMACCVGVPQVGRHSPPLTISPSHTHVCVCVCVCVQWTTDQDILAALRRAGYGTVRAIKMYENRGNGQFKG